MAEKRKQAGTKSRKKVALGRGLDALIPNLTEAPSEPEAYFECDTVKIRPNRYQPRRRFDETDLAELSASIREQGVIQPLLVRREGDTYELISGERRLRAAREAGLAQVPVIVRDVTDAEMLELSIIENIQREDLNPLEEAEAYHRLMVEFDLTQEAVAARVGRSRPAIANALRLRSLPEPIKTSLDSGELSMGHARALLGIEGTGRQVSVWQKVMAEGLSVRGTELLARRLKAAKRPTARPTTSGREPAYFSDLADELSRHLGTRVRIRRGGKRGRLEIEFYSDDDLDRLISRIRSA